MKKNNVRYDADHHAKAKAERSVLVTFDVYGHYAEQGRVTAQGAMTSAEAEIFLSRCMEMMQGRNKAAKKK
jgi:hypothetical protein